MWRILNKIRNDRFFKDLVITFVGQMAVMVISFILNKVISNQYSIADFGTYNLIKRTASVVSFVMLMAMGIAIPKYIAEANAKNDKKEAESYMLSGFIIIVVAFVVLFLGLSLLNKQFSVLMFGDETSSIYFKPICFFSFGTALITYVYSYYRGVDRFIKYNIIGLMMQLGMLVIAFIVPKNLGVLHYVWAVFLMIYGFVEMAIIFRFNSFSFRGLKKKLFTMGTMLEYSVPRVPGEFILFAYNLVPLVVIQHRFGSENVAFFSAALAINSLISPLFSLVGTILLPFVSKSLVNNEKGAMKQKIKVLAILYLVVSIIAVIAVYFVGEWLLVLLYNKNYVESISIVRITIIAIIPNAFYLLLRNPLDGISKFPYNTICLLISFVVYVGLLIVANSMEFCAVALIIAYVILGVLSLFFWERATNK